MEPSLRRIEVVVEPVRGYRTPSAAIDVNVEADERLRRFDPSSVAGEVVVDLRWTDAALTVELASGRCLEFRAMPEKSGCPVTCALDDRPLVPVSGSCHEDAVLSFGPGPGGIRRSEVAGRVRGGRVGRVMVTPDGAFLGIVEVGTLTISRVRERGSGREILIWT